MEIGERKRQFYKNEIDMTTGPILKKMLMFAIPVVLTGLLQFFFNAADVMVVGRFAGDEALAAVGVSGAPTHLVVNLLIGMGTGVNVVVARAFGAGKEKEISQAVHTAILLSLIGGAVVTVVGLFSSEWLLLVMGTGEDVLPLAKDYLDIIFIGAPIMALYNFGAAILRGRGDTRRPLLYLAMAGMLNVALNLYFVIVLHLGVRGVALATVLSQILSATLVIRCLMREQGAFRLQLKKLGLTWSKVKPIMIIGIPTGIQGMLFSVSNMAVQSSVNSFGKIFMAGSSAASSIEAFTFISMDGFSQSAVSFTSQNMGAGKLDRVPMILKTAVICTTVSGLLMGLMSFGFGRQLLGIYSRNPAVIEAGMVRLLYIAAPYFLCGIMNVVAGVIRGMGYAMVPTIITLIGVCGFRIIWLEAIAKIPQTSSIAWVFLSYPVTWLITALVLYAYFRSIYAKNKISGAADEIL